ncbi:MAG: hypothetical protein K2G01_06740 [Paramuribaculum sp.]|nr:hypothetical protein [Paramuribaculum sp.]
MIYFPQPILPPFRCEFVGDAAVPDALSEARSRKAAGEISADDVAVAEDHAVENLVKELYELGFEEISDGNLRGAITAGDLIGTDPAQIVFDSESLLLRNFNSLRSMVPFGVIARQDLLSPASVYCEAIGRNSEFAGCAEGVAANVVAAMTDAMMALYGLGCRSVLFIDSTWGNPDLDFLADINNRVAASLPPDMAVAMRPLLADMDYPVETVVGRMKAESVKSLYIHSQALRRFDLLEHVDGGRNIVVGLHPELEEQGCQDKIVSLIELMSCKFPLECLSISNSGIDGREATNYSGLRRKLRLIKQAAEATW